MPEQGGKLKQAFIRCYDSDAFVREKRLLDLEVEDPALAAQVRELFASSENAGAMGLEHDDTASELNQKASSQTTDSGAEIDEQRLLSNGTSTYRVQRKIGVGGMGIVYRARQLSPIERDVAIKVIKPGMESPHVMARFEAERHVLSLVDHRCIAKVLDAGLTETSRPYFVLELVQGSAINKFCNEHDLSLEDRLKLFVEVCIGVEHAHRRGIIHRDLKPSNILAFMQDGEAVVKIIDFGIAKLLQATDADATQFTHHLQIVGTLMYMSPERLEYGSRNVDTRSDVYSLGVVLYELLTGQTLFGSNAFDDASFGQKIEIIRNEDPISPSRRISTNEGELRTSLQPARTGRLCRELDWIVLKALHKDPEERYESAVAMAADVRKFLNGDAVEAGPPSRLYRIRKLISKHRKTSSALAICFVLLIIAIIGLVWEWRAVQDSAASETRMREKLELALENREQQLEVAENARIRAGRALYANQLYLASHEWPELNAPFGIAQLLSTDPEFRGFEYQFLYERMRAGLLAVGQTKLDRVQIFPYPDNQRALLLDGIEMGIWNIETCEKIQGFSSIEPGFLVPTATISPDGKWLAHPLVARKSKTRSKPGETPDASTSKLDKIQIRDANTMKLTAEFGCEVGNKLHFSPNGKYLVSFDGKAGFKLIDVANGKLIHDFPASELSDSALIHCHFSDNQEMLVCLFENQTRVSLELASGKLTNARSLLSSTAESSSVAKEHADYASRKLRAMQICDSGDTAVSFHGGGLIFVRSWPDWKPQHLLVHKQPVSGFDISADGRRVLTWSRDLVVRSWDATSGELLAINAWHTSGLSNAKITPDGNRMLSTSQDGSFHSASAETQSLDVSLDIDAGMPNKLSLAADAELLAVATRKGVISIVDRSSGIVQRNIQTPFERLLLNAQFRPGTETLAAVGMPSTGLIHMWNARTGKKLEPIICGERGPSSLAFSPDGKHLAVGVPRPQDSELQTGETQVWHIDSKNKVSALDPLDAQDMWLSFSPDGRFLVGMSWAHLKIWSTKDWKLIRSLRLENGGLTRDLTVSHDGQFVAISSASSHEVQLIEIETGRRTLIGKTGVLVTAIEFVPYGNRLLTGSKNGVLDIWDPVIAKSLMTLQRDAEYISDILIPAGGNCLLTSIGRELRVWNFKNW